MGKEVTRKDNAKHGIPSGVFAGLSFVSGGIFGDTFEEFIPKRRFIPSREIGATIKGQYTMLDYLCEYGGSNAPDKGAARVLVGSYVAQEALKSAVDDWGQTCAVDITESAW